MALRNYLYAKHDANLAINTKINKLIPSSEYPTIDSSTSFSSSSVSSSASSSTSSLEENNNRQLMKPLYLRRHTHKRKSIILSPPQQRQQRQHLQHLHHLHHLHHLLPEIEKMTSDIRALEIHNGNKAGDKEHCTKLCDDCQCKTKLRNESISTMDSLESSTSDKDVEPTLKVEVGDIEMMNNEVNEIDFTNRI